MQKSDIMTLLTNNKNITSNRSMGRVSSDRSMGRVSSDRSMGRVSSDRSMGRVSSDRSMETPNMNNVISRLNKYANI